MSLNANLAAFKDILRPLAALAGFFWYNESDFLCTLFFLPTDRFYEGWQYFSQLCKKWLITLFLFYVALQWNKVTTIS